jgi:serine acetyltransferase
MRLLRQIARDSIAIARAYNNGRSGFRELASTAAHDGSQVLMLSRLREAAQRWGIPIVGPMLRRAQTALFGVEIARDVALGEGVVFVHTVGVVIGGDAQVGDRVVFLGSNTVGSIGQKGYPRIGNDVIIGAGARILGPVRIGDGASVGANAVVLTDVPAGATALGVPARSRNGQTSSDPK